MSNKNRGSKTSSTGASHTTIDIRPELRKQQKTLERMNKTLTELCTKLTLVLESSPINNGRSNSRKNRDPNRPKKNKNGYLFFCQDKRESVKKKHPNRDGKELVRILSKMWNQMTEKEKKPYQDKASKDKDRYRREMEEYNKKQVVAV